MDTNDFSVVSSALDDCRRLIAAGKTQRWDVVKWGVTVDLALAAVSASLTSPPTFLQSLALFVLAAGVSWASWRLVWHYNHRVTGARNDATYLAKVLTKNGINFNELVGHNIELAYSSGEQYDGEELTMFKRILTVAPLLVFVRFLFELV